MKTLTVTFHHTSNYGATMQMFALHHTIKNIGHENVVLETALPTTKKKKTLFSSPKVLLRNIYIGFFSKLRKKEQVALYRSFKEFKNNNVQFTRPYVSMQDLRDDAPEVDCLITGSDQVWNMTTTPSMIPSRFLEFGKKDSVRCSFAASIEKMNYSEEQKEYVRNQLSRFKGITVREDSAKKYLESFSNLKVERLLDPVFLLDKEEWGSFAKKPRIDGPYILCYQVLSNKLMQKVAFEIKKRTGYPVVSICNMPFKWIKSDYSFFDVSPEEFLGLYRNAAYVVTTSFHGTAFGLLFNKPTYSLVRKDSANRIVDIMNLFGLSDFIVTDGNEITKKSIDWDMVNMHMAKEREKQKNYLKDMLS